MAKALDWMQQEQEDYERALMRAPQRMASATIADAHKTYEDFVADELADIRAERAKSQARLEHTARLARAREQGILEAERDWHHSPEHVEAHQKEVAAQTKPKRGRKPTKAPARLGEILDALDEFAAAKGEGFDRNAMFGPLGESWEDADSFHWMCAQIDPAFRRAKDTFEKHRAGVCAVMPYAERTDFYRRALPHIAPKLGVALNVHHLPKLARKTA
ncbi:hypothetical protein MXC99_01245 [Thauera aromatica]|uniref:hypothetical protein n=1 Tax=Thauera aromatica TaxID=59405 RepID=UPI001FFCA286|nr:hypothetical protein [Thauera aromatica]MCK2086818.1 hypothetical protein [Thauera aromatica]